MLLLKIFESPICHLNLLVSIGKFIWQVSEKQFFANLFKKMVHNLSSQILRLKELTKLTKN